MTRLTNNLKEVITQNALEKSGVIQQQKELDLEYNKLALDVRIEALGGKEKTTELDNLHQTTLKMVSDLSDGIGKRVDLDYAEYTRLYAAFGGMSTYLNYGVNKDDMKISMLTPSDTKCRFSADHQLSVRFSELENKKRNLKQKMHEIKANVKSALDSATTVKRLLTIWPEAKELLPKDVEKASVQLPALKVEKLNEIIGLPTEKAA
nr:hypothetical protein [Providencia rettgeri]